jgi:hypothetical protein
MTRSFLLSPPPKSYMACSGTALVARYGSLGTSAISSIPSAGRDADHSPPSSAEVENEELYLLSPQAPSWHVEGLLLNCFPVVGNPLAVTVVDVTVSLYLLQCF